jgi:YbbR domain-containing protein
VKLRVLRGRDLPPVREPAPGPEGPTPPWRRLLRLPSWRDLRATISHNRGLKIVSLLLAIFLWFSINVSERDAEGTVELPLRVSSLGAGMIVTNQPAKPVAVTVRGPRTLLDGIDERRAQVALDLGDKGPGEVRIELAADMIRPKLPRRLKIVRIEPARVKVRVERLIHRRLPVKVELAGLPPLGYTAEATVTPGEVDVSGPATKVDDLKEIKTEPVPLRAPPDPQERAVLLSWAGDFVSFTPDHVQVGVTFPPTMMARKFEHLDVALRNVPDGTRAKLTPPRVDLIVEGPQRILSAFKLPDGSVYVDAAGLEAGSHRVTPRVDLPDSLEVTGREPEVQTLEITPARGGTR